MRIASWNVNSVRRRIDLVARFAQECVPDILCLQEIKCREAEFPSAAFVAMGLPHLHIVGQKGLHGVAIASRLPLLALPDPAICPHGEARAAAALIAGVEVHCLYVPAGGDLADPHVNPKFAHKLAVLASMRRAYSSARPPGAPPLVLAGDFNVAPGEHDVWSHTQLLDVVSHTPVETQALGAVIEDGGLIDLARHFRPEPEKLFTWWSYRSPDWTRNNRGRRLDHIWGCPKATARASDFAIHQGCRAWEGPSDHVPVVCEIAP